MFAKQLHSMPEIRCNCIQQKTSHNGEKNIFIHSILYFLTFNVVHSLIYSMWHIHSFIAVHSFIQCSLFIHLMRYIHSLYFWHTIFHHKQKKSPSLHLQYNGMLLKMPVTKYSVGAWWDILQVLTFFHDNLSPRFSLCMLLNKNHQPHRCY